MALSNEILKDLQINPHFKPAIADLLKPFRLFTYVDILIVVDTQIATQPGVGFGIGTVIDHIKKSKVGCMRFRVDIAQRNSDTPNTVNSPAEFSPKYTSFRFDMTDDGNDVIDKYEQIWCFGFEPGNDGGPDSNIDQPSALPATDSELAKLAEWMSTKKGGLFATGDHDYLGASMCRRIPRIGTMRLWTNDDGVPPINTEKRIDTLRPPSAAYEPGAPGGPLALSNNSHQGDLTVQPIQWHPWKKIPLNFFTWKERPHPVLCHPSLGPIDIMPDHAHEGLCRDTGTVLTNKTYNFDGNGEKPEYPDAVGPGAKPEPVVIAYGSTLSDPPYNFAKGEQPARAKFPMISVYDGHLAGVGRCATDSTWHHWMDVNLLNIKADEGDDWEKISRYFLNLAVWLNPPGVSTNCLSLSTVISQFEYQGLQEYSRKLPTIELGRIAIDKFKLIYGPCWVTDSIIDILGELNHPILEWPRKPGKIPNTCLSCPPFEMIEQTVVGAMVRTSFELTDQLKRNNSESCKPKHCKNSTLESILLKDTNTALNDFCKNWMEEIRDIQQNLNKIM